MLFFKLVLILNLDKFFFFLTNSFNEIKFSFTNWALIQVLSPSRNAFITINMATAYQTIFLHASITNITKFLFLMLVLLIQFVFLLYFNISLFVCLAKLLNLLFYMFAKIIYYCDYKILVLSHLRNQMNIFFNSNLFLILISFA